MVTPRRSARVAAQENTPDYTEPNESGIKRKASTTGGSPSAKRGRKSKSKENLKEQKTLDDAMDIDQPKESQPAPSQKSDPAPTKPAEPTEPKEPEKQQETRPEKPAPSVEQPSEDKPAGKVEDTKPAEPASEPKAEDLAPAVSQNDEAKPAPEPSEPPKDTSTEGAPLKKQISIDAFVSTAGNKSPSVEEPAAQSTNTEPRANQEATTTEPETQKQDDPTPAAPPNTQAEPPKQETQPSVEPIAQNAAAADSTPSQNDSKPMDSTTAPSNEGKTSTPQEQKHDTAPTTNGDAVEPKARTDDVPSSILEKGIIYFFFRPRVNISDPHNVSDIARSYFILRPLPHGAALGDGPIPDGNNARLIALPKKVLPISGKDRFMVFVEKAKTNYNELKNNFMTASDYATKTQGTSHTPPVTPLAEGVYAITTTGRESHLAYMTTIPSSLGEVQKDIGLRESGSFVVSAKNPKYPGPANASLGTPPDYPSSILDEFRDLRWMPLQPKLLDYVNTQFLLIGESSGVEKGLLADENSDAKETPMEEMEKLEGEDEIRVKHLKGDDAVFVDLGLSKKDFPQVPSTW